MSAAKTFTGVIHGNAIELERKTDMPEGQQVTVTVEPLLESARVSGEGLRRSAGAWNDDPKGLDAYLDWSRAQRKNARRELES